MLTDFVFDLWDEWGLTFWKGNVNYTNISTINITKFICQLWDLKQNFAINHVDGFQSLQIDEPN